MSRLILLRHGQSQWNLENRFTGWTDISLTEKGVKEAQLAGELMKKNNINIDIIFSSMLKRANETAKHVLEQMDLNHLWNNKNLIMTKNQSLNERDYGDLVGLNKKETADKYGHEQVHIWRRSFDIPPPGGESLKDVVARVKPYYDEFIEPEIKNNKDIIIVAHGNSLRAIMIRVGLYRPEEISQIELPTGSPFIIIFEDEKVTSFKYSILVFFKFIKINYVILLKAYLLYF